MVSYRALFSLCRERLASDFEAAQLFSHVTGWRTADLATVGETAAPARDLRLLQELCGRRIAGEPLQYILGEWEFYGLPLLVGEGVLIPRQDTEAVVDTALELLRGVTAPEVLDLCSGSGCIAIAIAHERADAAVTAVELSDAAFGYLTQNVERNGVAVTAVHGDLFDYTHPRPLDLLTANPPYIRREELAALQEEVRHEPAAALDGGEDGLDFYRAIAQLYRTALRPGGRIVFEAGDTQAVDILHILRENGYAGAETRRDLAGHTRVVTAVRGE